MITLRHTIIRFHLHGIVREAESGVGLGGLFVKAYDKDLFFDDLLGTAYTKGDGRFDIVTESSNFRDFFELRPDLYLKIYSPGGNTLLFNTEHAIRWNAGQYETFDVSIPRPQLADFAPKRGVYLAGEDGRERSNFQAGESLTIKANGLRPITAHRVTVQDEKGKLFTDTLITNAVGEIEPTVIWPLIGIEDPRSKEPVRVEDAVARWGGRRIHLEITDGARPMAGAVFSIDESLDRPLVVATDKNGYVRHGFEIGDGEARASLYAFPQWESARVFMVPRQHNWTPGDLIQPVELVGGRLALADVNFEGTGPRVVTLARAAELRPGAYDFIVRRIRYGYEDDDDMVLRREDVLGGRLVTGLVVREPFMASKVIRGGCTNIQQIAGRYLGIWPYMNFTNVFQVGENIYGALDPSALDPAHTGKMVAIYIVPHKTAAQWSADSSLQHLPLLGGNASTQKFLTQSWCTNANLRLLWPAASQVGEYDVVADFGNDTSDPTMFTPNDSYDMPLDIIDGYINPGFRVVPDPTTDTSFPHAGTFSYDESTEGTVDVLGDGGGWTVPLRAVVYFPADMPGATAVADVSPAQANYPLVVVVHGNGTPDTSYLGYNYLLPHLARNGIIAASIHLEAGMESVPRVRTLRRHLEILFTRFGSRVANNVGLMGHSRGGEAVISAAKRNHDESWGYNINAVIPLAPTDQYLTGALAGPWTPPLLVIYGSLDGDIEGIEDTGFEHYDRGSGMRKSMAFVYGACHDRFNTEWGDFDLTLSTIGPMDVARVISAAAHQAVAKGYMTAFFRQHLKGETQWEGIFRGEWMPAAVRAAAPTIKICVQYEDTSVRTVDDFEGAHTATSWQASTIGGTVAQAGLPATPQEDDLATIDAHSPHDTSGVQLRWNNLTDGMQWDIPLGGQRNVTGFAALSFRITQVVDSASNPAGQPQDLRVTLTDGLAVSRAIRVSKFMEIPFPDVRQMNDLTKSALQTIRIPLTAYTIRCLGVPEVNLTNVVSVKFEFAEKPTGEIAIDSLQFTQ
jgi:hypothetical protein